jgi:L-cysteate sulfo-lyase
MFGATIHHVDTKDWDAWEDRAEELKKELEKEGKKVYSLPVGGSTPTGALGYVAAMGEIMEQGENMGIEFQTLIHPTSSVGTQTGLVVGKAISGWAGNIIGIAVVKNKPQLEDEIKALADQTASLLGVEYNPADISVDDAYLGEEYAARTEKGTEAIELFARREGIVLDHVYSGKGAAGMIDYARHGRFGKNENILFIHTGGNIELFE